jgi:Tfp pilus assembly protein PilF
MRISSLLRRSATRVTLAALVSSVLSVLSVACGSPNGEGPQAANPERQASSEYDLARDAFYRGRLHEALDHAEKANRLDDSNAKALYFTGLIYLGFCSLEGTASPNCRFATAEDVTRRAMKADPQFRDARNTLGQILIHENKYEDAIKVLEPLTKDPAYVANYLAWGNYGWAQVLAGRVDDGIASLRNSVTEPRFCTGHYRLGMAYEKKGNLREAEKSFTSAVETPSPECQALQDAWFERANVRVKEGNAADARGDFARCREIGANTDTGKACARLAGGAAPTPVQPLPASHPPSVVGGNVPTSSTQTTSATSASTSTLGGGGASE